MVRSKRGFPVKVRRRGGPLTVSHSDIYFLNFAQTCFKREEKSAWFAQPGLLCGHLCLHRHLVQWHRKELLYCWLSEEVWRKIKRGWQIFDFLNDCLGLWKKINSYYINQPLPLRKEPFLFLYFAENVLSVRFSVHLVFVIFQMISH